MANVIARIKAIITADNKKYKKSMKEVVKTTEKTTKKVNKFGSLIKGAMSAAFVIAAVKIGKALLNITKSMDLMETKATIVFGSYKSEIMAAADQTAASMGLTKTEFVNAAAGIQDLLIPMGFMRGEATGMAKDMMNLAGALSAWSGGQVTAAGVSDIFTKAMLGEREQLKTLGISISEAEIQQELAIKGMKKFTGVALAQAKAQVTLELITRKSTDAQDAFKTSQDSMVIVSAKISGNIRSIGENIAIILNPALVEGAERTLKLTNALRQMSEDAALIATSKELSKWEKWQFRLWGLTGTTAGLIKQMEILGTAIAEDELFKMIPAMIAAGDSMEDLKETFKEFGDETLAKAQQIYTDHVALKTKETEEIKNLEAEKLATLREGWAKESAEYRAHWLELLGITELGAEGIKTADLANFGLSRSIQRAGEAAAMAGGIFSTIPDQITPITTAITIQASAWDNLRIAMRQAFDTQMLGEDIMNSVMNTAINTSEQISEAYKNITLAAGFSQEQVNQAADDMKNSFRETAKAAANAARLEIKVWIAKGVAAAISKALAGVPFPFNIALAAAGGVAATALFDRVIPSFASGGMAIGPQLALIGDNPGRKEAIIPSEDFGKFGGGPVEVFGTLKGSDIHLSSKRYNNQLARSGRI